MSDKNITELEWKKFSKGKGFKDAAFVKALAALETGKTPEAKLAALDSVEKEADALRKANKADKELGSYLDGAEKAVDKERKLQQAEAKKAAASSSDEEEDSPALLTTKMIPLLRVIKKGEAMQTMVAITGKEVAVLISRKPIGPPKRKLLNDYLGVSGGVKYAVGQVIWEENANTFVLQTQAGGLAKKIKAALYKQTEQRVKVRVRGEDPNDIDDDGEPSPEQEGGETESQQGQDIKAEGGTTIPPAPPLPTAGENKPTQEQEQPEQQGQESTVDEGTAFNARLAALMPKVKEVITAAGPNATDVKLKISEAGVFARKKEFGPAHALLDEAEKLMTGGGQQQSQGEDLSAAFNARLAALMPKVKETIVAAGPQATDVKLKVSEAGVFARKKEFDKANVLLDEAEELIAQGAGEPSEQQKYQDYLAELEPRYLAVLKTNPAEATKMRAVFGYAADQAIAKDWAKGHAALVRLDKMLGGGEQGDGTPKKATDTGYTGIVAYRKTLLDLRAAVAKVEGQIAALVQAIPSQLPDEADLAEELAEDLRESNEALQDLVDEAMGTAENADTPITRALTSRLDELIAEVASNEVIQHVDKNPFGVSMSVQATLGDALKAVRAALPVPN